MTQPHPGATLTPGFRQFVPGLVAQQPWYAGDGPPTLRPAGLFRLSDPDGQAGIETHVLTDGNAVYQVPMTYRDGACSGPPAEESMAGSVSVRGQLLAAAGFDDELAVIDLRWVLTGHSPGDPARLAGADAAGVVAGT